MFERDTTRRALRFEAFLAIFILADVSQLRGQPADSEAQEWKIFVHGRFDSGMTTAVNSAVKDARRKLENRECQLVFSDFRDASGRTIQENLDARKETAAGYLRWLIFRNSSDQQYCMRSRSLAGTNPGDRVIQVCGQFQRVQMNDPGFAAASIIHEELHSLGLSENPPSSFEINSRVMERCGR